ncbi:MAG: hypothetical protein L3J35_13470 [Bacteroidales bacterium]|nr:hypothetical protein [Bacteroidales bacterium]
MSKKSLSEEAKDLFSSWKSEIEERDGHILERKKQRDKEDAEFNEQLKQQYREVSTDLNKKAKKAFEISAKEFKEFSQAVKEGTATIYQKLEIEKHLEQLYKFLKEIKSKSAEKFKEFSNKMKAQMDDFEKEIYSEVENEDEKKSDKNEIDELIKLAQEEYELSKK